MNETHLPLERSSAAFASPDTAGSQADLPAPDLQLPAHSWPDVGAAGDSTSADFEHRRCFASVRNKLFGTGDAPMIGRYPVIKKIGAGGMGEVYLCEDRELGRRLAVKRVLGLGTAREQERLRREAQILARLSHPNVVQVYEIGAHEGRTFIAMEYVEGQTLAEWLEQPRERDELLARFIAAGRGLAAAHSEGIVHRDFKPDNVLIGEQGLARVVDFGLALDVEDRALEGETQPGPPGEGSPRELAMSRTRLSATGTMVGTMRYMPLEQVRGRSVDERSDQFAYCVALYEALWGAPPFPVDSPAARIEALERDAPRPPRGGRSLWPILRRGLAADPSQRWPSMDALLAALEAAPRRRRQAWLKLLGGATALLLGLPLLTVLVPSSGHTCSERARQSIVDPQLLAQVEARFAALEDPPLRESFAQLSTELDEWERQWQQHSASLCRTAQEPALDRERLFRRSACLQRQRRGLDELLALLAEGDERALGRASTALRELPTPADCATEHIELYPPDERRAAIVARVLARIERAHTLRSLGYYGRAEELALEADHEAQALAHRPLLALTRSELAKVVDVRGQRERAGQLYREAKSLAIIAGRDELIPALALERFDLLVRTPETLMSAGDELELARAHLVRLGEDPDTHARLHYAAGRLAEKTGNLRLAVHEYEAALLHEGEGRQRSSYLRQLARLLHPDDPARALTLTEDSLEAAVEAFGPAHPHTADAHYWVGFRRLDALREAPAGPRLAEAYASLRRAARLWRREGMDRRAGEALLAIAEDALVRDELALAQHELASAWQIFVGLEPSPSVERYAANLAINDARLAAARAQGERGLELARVGLKAYERAPNYDPLAPWILDTRELIAQLTLDSLPTGAPHPRRGVAWIELAELALLRDEYSRLAVPLEHARAHRTALRPEQLARMELLGVLAQLRRGRSLPRSAPERLDALLERTEDSQRARTTLYETLRVSERERELLEP